MEAKEIAKLSLGVDNGPSTSTSTDDHAQELGPGQSLATISMNVSKLEHNSLSLTRNDAVVPSAQTLQTGSNISVPPPNWLRTNEQLGPYGREIETAAQDLKHILRAEAAKSDLEERERVGLERAVHDMRTLQLLDFPAENVDVIAPANQLKKVFKLPYADRADNVSLLLHRVGDTLVLDGKLESLPKTLPRNEKELLDKELYSKFLYYSNQDAGKTADESHELFDAALTSPRQAGKRSGVGILESALIGTTATQESNSSGSKQPSSSFSRNIHWQFDHMDMLLGSDQLVFYSGNEHPSLSLQLADVERDIPVLTCIDFWLDNIINKVEELAICYHRDGIVQGYRILKTNEIPRMPMRIPLKDDGTADLSSGLVEKARFNVDEVQKKGLSILEWLQSETATKDVGTYVLHKAPGGHDLVLYDISNMTLPDASKDGDVPSTSKSSTSQSMCLPLGVLCFRMADKLIQTYMRTHSSSGPSTSGKASMQRAAKLLLHAMSLVRPREHPRISATIAMRLGDVYCGMSTKPATGLLDTTVVHLRKGISSPTYIIYKDMEADFKAAVKTYAEALQRILLAIKEASASQSDIRGMTKLEEDLHRMGRAIGERIYWCTMCLSYAYGRKPTHEKRDSIDGANVVKYLGRAIAWLALASWCRKHVLSVQGMDMNEDKYIADENVLWGDVLARIAELTGIVRADDINKYGRRYVNKLLREYDHMSEDSAEDAREDEQSTMFEMGSVETLLNSALVKYLRSLHTYRNMYPDAEALLGEERGFYDHQNSKWVSTVANGESSTRSSRSNSVVELSRELLRRLGDTENRIGMMYLAGHRITKSIEAIQKGLDWFVRAGDQVNTALLHCNLCECYRRSARTKIELQRSSETGERVDVVAVFEPAIKHARLAAESVPSFSVIAAELQGRMESSFSIEKARRTYSDARDAVVRQLAGAYSEVATLLASNLELLAERYSNLDEAVRVVAKYLFDAIELYDSRLNDMERTALLTVPGIFAPINPWIQRGGFLYMHLGNLYANGVRLLLQSTSFGGSSSGGSRIHERSLEEKYFVFARKYYLRAAQVFRPSADAACNGDKCDPGGADYIFSDCLTYISIMLRFTRLHAQMGVSLQEKGYSLGTSAGKGASDRSGVYSVDEAISALGMLATFLEALLNRNPEFSGLADLTSDILSLSGDCLRLLITGAKKSAPSVSSALLTDVQSSQVADRAKEMYASVLRKNVQIVPLLRWFRSLRVDATHAT